MSGYSFDFGSVLGYWPALLQGLGLTVVIAFVSVVLGALLGIACSWGRTSRFHSIRFVFGAYVELIRNTPLIVQCYFIVFGIASLHVRIPLTVAALLAITLNVAAYNGEIVRAGIEAIPESQREAAASLGLTRTQAFFRIILPPALSRVWPALTSQFILLLMGTSLLSAVGVDELFGAAQIVEARTFRNFEVFVVIWIIYFVLSVAFRKLFHKIGHRYFRYG